MKTSVGLMLAVAATAPLTFEAAQNRRDSSVTSLTIAAGHGNYAEIARGCEGQVLSKEAYRFHDEAVAIEHEFAGPAVLGIRGSRIGGLGGSYPDVRRDRWFWNPYGALEGRNFGFGLGYVFGREDWDELTIPELSGHLRLGDPRQKAALMLRVFEGVPAFTAGGLADIGVAFTPTPRTELWAGVTAGEPYDTVGGFLRAKTNVGRGFFTTTCVRLGESEGVLESGLSLALTWSAVHH